MPFAAGTTGLVYQGCEVFRPCKQRAVKVSICMRVEVTCKQRAVTVRTA